MQATRSLKEHAPAKLIAKQRSIQVTKQARMAELAQLAYQCSAALCPALAKYMEDSVATQRDAVANQNAEEAKLVAVRNKCVAVDCSTTHLLHLRCILP